MEPILLEYSKPLITRAIKSYWWRQVGPLFLVATIFMLVFLIYRVVEGDRSWLIGLVGAVVFMAIAMMAATYFVHLRRALTKLSNMGVPTATLELGEEQFQVSSNIGRSEILWSQITQLWRLNEVWLLFFSTGEFMTIPLSNISAENKEFIINKISQTGAKIA